VRVGEDQFFPADMIMLNSSEPQGSFHVETKNLDGETNLKQKLVAKDLVEPFSADQAFDAVQGVLNIEHPNNRIYKFDGNFDQSKVNKSVIPLSNDNVALRGMSLRNTEHVTGIVAYTGHDSKIQMNSADSVYKVSNISKQTNKQIMLVFMIQIICSMIGSAVGSTWMVSNVDEASYLSFNKDDAWNTNWFLLFI